jgi:signal transduction histidine kinase
MAVQRSSGSHSLLRKFLPTLAVVVLAVTAGVLGLGISVMRGALRERATERAQILATNDQVLIERLPRAGPHLDLREIIASFEDHPDVAAARLLSPSGLVMVSSRPQEVGELMTDHASQVEPQGDLIATKGGGVPAIHTVRPVANSPACRSCHDTEEPVVAMLDLDVAVNPHLFGMGAFGALGSAMGVLYLVSVGATMLLLMRTVVHRPVSRLTDAMSRVQRGDLSQEVAHTGTRELDALGDGFNLMVSRLRDGARAEREARRLEMERAEQLAVVGELAAGLAHEIRSPLSGVKAAVEVIAADMSAEDRGRPILREAAVELGQMDQILKDLLQYARPRPLELADADLNEIAADACRLLEPKASKQGVLLVFSAKPSLPPVLADHGQVRQVILNLMLNALQAVGEPEDGGRVTFSTDFDAEDVRCSVVDTGPGVPPEQADQVFRPFHTTKGSGTGLGLAISRRIIEPHGGRLALDNPGRPGAAFSFTRPRQTGAEVRSAS